MSAALLAELERLDTEPAPPARPGVCTVCGDGLPPGSPPDTMSHADCDKPIGVVLRDGTFVPADEIAAARLGERHATVDGLFDAMPLDDLAFCLRVAADDRGVLGELLAELTKPAT
jgi:hypothetical protein